MIVDVKFDFAKVYDINKFDVTIGQKFMLLNDSTDKVRWFPDNDPVLALVVDADTGIVNVEATGIGTSVILIFDSTLTYPPKKELTINVVDKVLDPATDLNLSSGTPVAK